jgi:hypothetical protein
MLVHCESKTKAKAILNYITKSPCFYPLKNLGFYKLIHFYKESVQLLNVVVNVR